MTLAWSGTIEGGGLVGWNLVQRIDKSEMCSIGLVFIELIGFVANRIAPSAFHAVAIVIEDLFERPEVNDSLVAFETGALLAFECLDGD